MAANPAQANAEAAGGVANPIAAPRARERRGGGRGNGRRQGGGGGPRRNAGPPNANANDGPPPAQHLASTSTAERNDPLWVGSVCSQFELFPSPNLAQIWVGAEHLPLITDVIHRSIVTVANGYARRVPQCALAYFCAVSTWARMLRLERENGGELDPMEDRFVDQVAALNLRVPALLAHYLAGMGNTRVPSGRDLRFKLLAREYVDTANVNGFFGQISPETQPLYQNYPCLAVYAAKMMADSSRAQYAAAWPLPAVIVPDAALPGNGGGPTAALLGWSNRSRLTEQQLGFLEAVGISADERFPSSNRTLPLNIAALLAVQTELDAADKVRKTPVSTAVVGSVGQLGLLSHFEELLAVTTTGMFHCAFRIPGEVSFSASAFGYRVFHPVNTALAAVEPDDYEDQFVAEAPWAIWSFNQGRRCDYVAAGNRIFTGTATMLEDPQFATPVFEIRQKLEALERAVGTLARV